MHSLLAYTQLVAASAVDSDMPFAFDGWASQQNAHAILPRDVQLEAAYAGGATLNRLRLDSPSLRYPFLPQVWPVERAILTQDDPALAKFNRRGPKLPAIDELAVRATNDTAAADREVAALWVTDSNYNIPAGNIQTVRFTAAIVGGNLVWTAGALTFDQVLAAGQYAVVGMAYFEGNALFGRLDFTTGGMKPGCLAMNALTNESDEIFRNGGLGTWGTFYSTSPPNLEVFGSAALAVQVGYLDLIRVSGPGPGY